MNWILQEILICPLCAGELQLFVFEYENIVGHPAGVESNRQEIISGVMKCGCGNLYPIIEGVPRFLEEGIKDAPGFIDQYREQIAKISPGLPNEKSPNAIPKKDDYENIRKSFSQEWGLFNYDEDKTWGWTLEERKKVFLDDIKMRPEDLSGKYLLDAGCGNGTMTTALSDFDLKIVGIDLNDRLGTAQRNRGKYSLKAKNNVQFIQGNLLRPPLKGEVFDFVYSSGVIHHTPSSKSAFDRLVAYTRKGGRLYVWVYGRRSLPVRLFFWFGRNIKNLVSLKALGTFCRGVAPFYKTVTESLNAFRLAEFRKRTTREITLDLFDAFAPRFNHCHTEEEVRMWFQEYGFKNINVSGVQKHGFGMYGDRV